MPLQYLKRHSFSTKSKLHLWQDASLAHMAAQASWLATPPLWSLSKKLLWISCKMAFLLPPRPHWFGTHLPTKACDPLNLWSDQDTSGLIGIGPYLTCDSSLHNSSAIATSAATPSKYNSESVYIAIRHFLATYTSYNTFLLLLQFDRLDWRSWNSFVPCVKNLSKHSVQFWFLFLLFLSH